jgi:MHS family proline/betaine transporter-like MFS transporter
VIAATIGNALEWFDLVIYGFFSSIIASQFFPADDPATSLLIALGTFGGAFFIRPLGAIVIGSYADRVGRKSALMLTMSLMMLGTFLIAATPSYAAIGVLAPAVIILARLVQGFSAGGEFAAATAFLAEQSPDRRAFYSSLQSAGQGITMLLAAGFGAGLTQLLTHDQLADWGWRVPFAFGLLIGPVAVYIRRKVSESPEFDEAHVPESPLSDAIGGQKANMAVALGIVILGTVSMYLLLYMPTYATTTLGLSEAAAFTTNLVVGIGLILLAPLSGLIADRRGRIAVALPAALALLLLPVPLFSWLANAPSPAALLAAQTLLVIPVAFYLGVMPALLTELFPARVRTTSMSLSYNVAVMIFGGLAPFIVTWLITSLGIRIAPGVYLTVAAALSLSTLIVARRRGVR